ncbi:MAG: DUF1015 domain-containing protein [Spirochaetaceae bacterium]|jgi:hypothetical protein|nr:DUF1015 domain-containing protein [Spirochaetaceae bacterium]
MNYVDRLAALGIAVPELLFPAPEIDLSKWAVIACDQATQDRLYWERVRSLAGDAPSSLNLIFPEVYLEDSDRKDRIASIHRTMKEYLDKGIFAPPQKALVYVERDTPFHRTRRGLIIALDLEQYDWKTDSAPLIRPTEGTVSERLPPRMEIRRAAPLETPHILILIDDEDNTLLPVLAERAKKNPAIYNTKLMPDSGQIQGWKLDDEADWEMLADGLETLQNKTANRSSAAGQNLTAIQSAADMRDKESPFLFAVGDGNHSLAAAKAVWEEYKAVRRDDPAIMNHNARWALVELENLYDPALAFEPIHRLLLGADVAVVQRLLARLPGYACRKAANPAELAALVENEHCGRLRLGLASGPDCFLVEADPVPLAVDAIQPLLDAFIIEENNKAGIDYIHGTEELFRLACGGLDCAGGAASAASAQAVGILLPPFRKQGLFETVAKRGPLPRKSFSMGESCEKRFYLECRKLFW